MMMMECEGSGRRSKDGVELREGDGAEGQEERGEREWRGGGGGGGGERERRGGGGGSPMIRRFLVLASLFAVRLSPFPAFPFLYPSSSLFSFSNMPSTLSSPPSPPSHYQLETILQTCPPLCFLLLSSSPRPARNNPRQRLKNLPKHPYAAVQCCTFPFFSLQTDIRTSLSRSSLQATTCQLPTDIASQCQPHGTDSVWSTLQVPSSISPPP
jgi:hypothetical protein